jgi:pimeloyl-ACP methyl ester carboxylesterase
MSKHLRECLLVVPLALLTACANVIDFMPKEIQDAEKPSIEAARQLELAYPASLRSYTVTDRAVRYVELKQETPPRPLVIFIHGSPGLWRSWVHYLNDPDLQSRVDMIAMDRPGFGESGSGQIEAGFLKQTAALQPLLRAVQAHQQVILVGHAYGAALAASMAMRFPDKVTDLVLLAAPLDPKLQMESWFQYVADWPPVAWLLPTEIVAFNREYLGLERELTAMLPLWPQVTQRVSVILGENDEEVPVATADFAAQVLTRAQSVNVVRIANTNHFIPWLQSDRVKAQILEHVNAAQRQRSP